MALVDEQKYLNYIISILNLYDCFQSMLNVFLVGRSLGFGSDAHFSKKYTYLICLPPTNV